MKSLLESGPERCTGSPPSSASILMCPDDCSVNDRTDLVVFELQFLEYEFPDATVCPVCEPVVDRFPRTKSLWQITPRNTGLRAVQDGIDEEPIAELRFGALALLRQKPTQSRPLFIGQSVSMHRKLGSHLGSGHKFSTKFRDTP
jgi:hypothetical protein